MPNFWTAIEAANGANAMGVIRLCGALDLEGGALNPQGPVWVHAGERSGNEPGYDLTPVANNDAGSDEIKQVYWLPWKNRSVEKVLNSKLDSSNCRYFLTSMLTGCRFVATDTLVAHVSNEQGTAQEPTTNQAGRDHAESGILMEPLATHRRKLSISAVQPEPEKNGMNWGDDWDIVHSYQRDGKVGAGSAFVIGYKTHAGWTYKWLKHLENKNRPSGTWSIL
jgi:hypothetical protein